MNRRPFEPSSKQALWPSTKTVIAKKLSPEDGGRRPGGAAAGARNNENVPPAERALGQILQRDFAATAANPQVYARGKTTSLSRRALGRPKLPAADRPLSASTQDFVSFKQRQKRETTGGSVRTASVSSKLMGFLKGAPAALPPLPTDALLRIERFGANELPKLQVGVLERLLADARQAEDGVAVKECVEALRTFVRDCTDLQLKLRAQQALGALQNTKAKKYAGAQSPLHANAAPPPKEGIFAGAQPAFKFAEDSALRQQARIGDDGKVREVFTSHGYFFMSNSLASGTFGKFRMLRLLDGTELGAKEFALPDVERYHAQRRVLQRTKDGYRKTRISQQEDICDEIAFMEKLGHGIALFGGFRWRGKFFLLMTPTKGDVATLVSPLNDEIRARLTLAALWDGLDALRDLHVNKKHLHRDVKFENMLLGYDNKLVLADFGLSAPMHGALAQDNGLMGTFIAPELARQHNLGEATRYTPAGDLFALGASALSMLLPDIRNVLGPTLFASKGNFLGLAGHLDGYFAYEAWHDGLGRDAAGQVDLSRPGKQGTIFDAYFQQARAVEPVLTKYLLNTLLHPSPAKRSQAREAQQLLGARYPAAMLARARKDWRYARESEEQQEARQNLAAYAAVHRQRTQQQMARPSLLTRLGGVFGATA